VFAIVPVPIVWLYELKVSLTLEVLLF